MPSDRIFRKSVAHALSESTKIFGALAVVNVLRLTLEEAKRNEIANASTSAALQTSLFVIAFILLYVRFFHGSMILLYRDYIIPNKPEKAGIASDALSLIIIMPLFCSMSFFGIKDLSTFVVLLIFLLVADIFSMVSAAGNGALGNHRMFWLKLNAITVIALFVWLVARHLIFCDSADGSAWVIAACAIILGASAVDIWKNRSFYFGMNKKKATSLPASG